MGAAKYMVTVRYADELYPNTYFFNESPLANHFYYDMREAHCVGDLADGTQVQLWVLSPDGNHWTLKLSSDNA